MKIKANGKEYEIEDGATLPQFLEQLDHKLGRVVVERNRDALTPSEAEKTVLEDGDSLEIVRIVAGG